MSKVFFTSDLHFGHEKLCNGLRHMTADESGALIFENWNKTIGKRDKVYIVGDISMENPKEIECLKYLNGKKVVIGGNHDVEASCKILNDLGITVIGSLYYKGFIVTHIPIHPLELGRFKGNIHGHIHLTGDIDGLGYYEGIKLGDKYFNVNTEFHNYTPIEFNVIEEYFNKI